MREWAEAGDDLHLDDGRCADLTLRLVPREARERALAHAAGCAACEERLRRHASAAERARADRPRRALIAEGRERSFWHPVTSPVGICVMRTAESVVFTCWPPLPPDRYVSMRRSSLRMLISMDSSISGETYTLANDVWRRLAWSKGDMRTRRCTPISLVSMP